MRNDKKATSHQEKTTEDAKSIDDMFALAHAKARLPMILSIH